MNHGTEFIVSFDCKCVLGGIVEGRLFWHMGKQNTRRMLSRWIYLARRIYAWLFDHPGYMPLPETESKKFGCELLWYKVTFFIWDTFSLVRNILQTR
ncbi:hypothetical protein BDV41DRAFT_374606 [Aspergillus transmontanensis]|uniref:Uncharacterized protein n=1 Tax=Aspergillus transmontanensis TaxID=1034304 RepID=A0A5N6WBY3_9EURO|nr:hypothetical protein BDV41DRAFT_374606 [Aspergillus transmontanensis]